MRRRKSKVEKPKTQQYKQAPAVKEVADDLIRKFHSHLTNVDVQFVFNEKTPKNKKKEVWGKARLCSGVNAFIAYAGAAKSTFNHQDSKTPVKFFVIEISELIWHQLTKGQRVALVDHELSHCWVDENDRLCLMPHDVEEFSSIVRRHGLWRDDVQLFVENARQLKMFPEKGKAAEKPIRATKTSTV